MISTQQFYNIINNVTSSSLVTDVQIGRLYNISYIKRSDNIAVDFIKQVKSLSHKNGLKVSYNMVYSEIDNYDSLSLVRVEVAKLMYVSPITWIPTEEFGTKKICFGFFPYIKKEDFVFTNNKTTNDKTFDITQTGLNEIISNRIESKNQNIYKYPVWFDSDENRPYFFMNGQISGDLSMSYYFADDSEFPQSLSPREYALSVLKKMDLIESFVSEFNIVITSDAEKSFKTMGLLMQRLNVSHSISFCAYDLFDEEQIVFSFDDSQIDKISKHCDFFRLHNV